jgi:outer membrane protein TolC
MLRAAWIATLVCLFFSVTADAQQPNAAEVKRITLPEAQTQAANSAAVRAAQLSADAAKYHRQAATADYFPKIGSTFANLHFNKFMGETIALARRSVEVPLLNKDQSVFLATVTQPVTPLLKVRQAVNLARADERIAQAKLSQATVDVTSNLESSYFALLIAQLEYMAALQLETLRPRVQVAANGDPRNIAEFVEVERRISATHAKVAQLTRALNGLLGFAAETELALVVPEPLIAEPVSLAAARQRALATNPEVIEAEQTLAKAGAAVKLSKLEYVPDVAVMAGYSYQTAVDLLANDFSFLGVVATFNVFDFGKREKTLKERKTNEELAQMNLQAVKSRVSATVQTAFEQVEQASRLRNVRRESLVSSISGLKEVPAGEVARRFRAEAEFAQAEWDYRIANLQLRKVIGDY